MDKKVLFLVFYLPIAYCATASEDAPVNRVNKELGYACQSAYEAIGLMKEGEVKKNNEDELCGEAYCSKGVISYTSCGTVDVGPRCFLSGKNYIQPYPDCCGQLTCYD